MCVFGHTEIKSVIEILHFFILITKFVVERVNCIINIFLEKEKREREEREK
jgi:hypothetical protein